MNKFKVKPQSASRKFYSRRDDLSKSEMQDVEAWGRVSTTQSPDQYEELIQNIKAKLAITIEEELEKGLKAGYRQPTDNDFDQKYNTLDSSYDPLSKKRFSNNAHNNLNGNNNPNFISQYQNPYHQPASNLSNTSKPISSPYYESKSPVPLSWKEPLTHTPANNWNQISKPQTSNYNPNTYIQKESLNSPSIIENPSITEQPVTRSDQPIIKSDDRSKIAEEKMSFLEKELLAAYQRESKLKNKVDELELALNKAQTGLSAQIMDLKQDMPPVEPKKEENKLAALSEQLASVMKTISTEVSNEQAQASQSVVDSVPQALNTDSKPEVTKEQNNDQDKRNTKSTEVKKDKDESSKEKKSSGKKKYLIIFVAIILILLGIGVGIYFWINRNPQVDQNLLQQYLPEGVSPTPSDSSDSGQTNQAVDSQDKEKTQTGEVQGVSTSSPSKYAESYAEVDYTDTKWETHKNPQLGIEFDYPGNSTNVVRTDTSVTVLRKTGYIFKIQYIESALDLSAYWSQIKARNLTYKASEKTFRDYPALFLELAEPSDYPGDRYLVKKGEIIYDIWYATKSKNLNDDDAKRVDVMLNSLKFLT